MAKKRVGKFPTAFQRMAVERLTQCDNIGELAKELGIHRRLLYAWRDKLEPTESSEGPPANSCEATLRREVSRLKRVLAEKVLEVDLFKGALQTAEARRHDGFRSCVGGCAQPGQPDDADRRQPALGGGYQCAMQARLETDQPRQLVADRQLECCPAREGPRAEGGCKASPGAEGEVSYAEQPKLYRAWATPHEPGYHRV